MLLKKSPVDTDCNVSVRLAWLVMVTRKFLALSAIDPVCHEATVEVANVDESENGCGPENVLVVTLRVITSPVKRRRQPARTGEEELTLGETDGAVVEVIVGIVISLGADLCDDEDEDDLPHEATAVCKTVVCAMMIANRRLAEADGGSNTMIVNNVAIMGGDVVFGKNFDV